MSDPSNLKMYILVRDSIATGFAALGAAHASVACYMKFGHLPEVGVWAEDSFKKVVCKVTDEEFAEAKRHLDSGVLITEDTIGDEELAMAFHPREEWPECFRYYRLYS